MMSSRWLCVGMSVLVWLVGCVCKDSCRNDIGVVGAILGSLSRLAIIGTTIWVMYAKIP
jgi:hypothetical protein